MWYTPLKLNRGVLKMNNKEIVGWAGIFIVAALAWAIYHNIEINNLRQSCKDAYTQQYMTDSNSNPTSKGYQYAALDTLEDNGRICDAKYTFWDVSHWWNGY
jgi:hypothetical protein